MIGQDETSLSQSDYELLEAQGDDLSVRVRLQRFGPVWASHDTEERSGALFDAVLAGDYLVRVYVAAAQITIERLPMESAGDAAWEVVDYATGSPYSHPSSAVAPSITASSNSVSIFYYEHYDQEVRCLTCADISAETPEFADSTLVQELDNVVQLAAPNPDRVFIVTKSDTTYNRRFHVCDYDAGWTLTNSNIYYPFALYGFDAESVDDVDVVVMGADLPPLTGSRAVGTEVTTEVNRVNAVLIFRYQNGRWSEHEQIDVTDRLAYGVDRDRVRLSKSGDMLFLTYDRHGGTETHAYVYLAICRSKDGLHWEFPELVNTVRAPALVLPRSDYLYLVSPACTYRSPCCTWAEQAVTAEDVSDYVTALSSRAAELRTSTYDLTNPEDVLDGTLAKPESRVEVVTDLGYVYDEPVRVQVSVEDITAWVDERTVPERTVVLNATDRLARVNRVRSDYAAEFPGQQAGRDSYEDETDTGYGGLKFTAQYDGSWEADDGILQMLSNNKEAIAVSTFVADAFNGSAQVGFEVTTDDVGEYVGIIARMMDRDNFIWAQYYLDDDVIRLIRRVGGEDTTLATSSTLGWAKGTTYYMKLSLRYALVRVYVSADNITWTEVVWASGSNILTGMNVMSGNVWPWAGRFGLIGRGYSNVDVAEWEEPEPWLPPYIPPEVVDAMEIVIASAKTGQLGRTYDIRSASPFWEKISTGLPADGFVSDIELTSAKEAWATVSVADNDDDDSGLYYCPDIIADTPVWAQILSNRTAYNQTTSQVRQHFCSLTVDDNDECWVCMNDREYSCERTGYWHGNPSSLPSSYKYIYGECWTSLVGRATVRNPWTPSQDGMWNTMTAYGGVVYAAGNSGPLGGGGIWNLSTETLIANGYSKQTYAMNGRYAILNGSLVDFVTDPSTRLSETAFDLPFLAMSPGEKPLTRVNQQLYYDCAAITNATTTVAFGHSVVVGGGACFGESDDEILWVGTDPWGNGNARIAYSGDRGVTWAARDGNWALAMGAAWSGGWGVPHWRPAFIKRWYI